MDKPFGREKHDAQVVALLQQVCVGLQTAAMAVHSVSERKRVHADIGTATAFLLAASKMVAEDESFFHDQ